MEFEDLVMFGNCLGYFGGSFRGYFWGNFCGDDFLGSYIWVDDFLVQDIWDDDFWGDDAWGNEFWSDDFSCDAFGGVGGNFWCNFFDVLFW